MDPNERSISVVPYSPGWRSAFEAERAAILDACGPVMRQVHHIGSTAVPGLDAKPLIDLLGVVERAEDGEACVAALGGIGYASRGERGIPGRHYFTKGTPRSHHLHVYPAGHPDVERHIRFRDFLRSRPDWAAAYAHVKRTLAQRFENDPAAYAQGKAEICREIHRLALEQPRHRPGASGPGRG